MRGPPGTEFRTTCGVRPRLTHSQSTGASGHWSPSGGRATARKMGAQHPQDHRVRDTRSARHTTHTCLRLAPTCAWPTQLSARGGGDGPSGCLRFPVLQAWRTCRPLPTCTPAHWEWLHLSGPDPGHENQSKTHICVPLCVFVFCLISFSSFLHFW